MKHAQVWLAAFLAVVAGAAVSWAGRGDADARFEKVVPAAGLEAVSVVVSFHQVDVKVEDRADVAVTVELEGKGPADAVKEQVGWYTPEFEVSDGVFLVRSVRDSKGHGRTDHLRGRVTVLMPPGLDLSVETASGDCTVTGDLGDGELRTDTSSGDVTLTGACARITTDSSSGDVRLMLARPAEKVSVDSSSGDLLLEGGCAELEADTSSGDVTGSRLTGDAEVDTASGDVVLQWAAPAAGVHVDVETASGDVRLVFPRGTAVAGEVSTASGTIDSGPGGTWKLRGRVLALPGGPDAATVEVETASGDVKILTAD